MEASIPEKEEDSMSLVSFFSVREELKQQYDLARASFDLKDADALLATVRGIANRASSLTVGRGRAIRYYLEHAQLYVHADDPFPDHIDSQKTPLCLREEAYERHRPQNALATALQDTRAIRRHGDFGHTVPDWERLLTLGIDGIRREAAAYLNTPSLTEEAGEFYTAVIDAYTGLQSLALRLARLTEKKDSPNARFATANLRAISSRAPETLGEAMQLYFLYFAAQHFVEGENLRSLGFVDTTLLPFYQAELARGTDEEEIRELIRYFLMKWNAMRMTANIPFSISREPNELSYLILEEYVKLGVPDPKIHILLTKDTPARLRKLVLSSIRDGNNSFVLMNDAIVRRSLGAIGVSPADAASYTLVGCYEPAVLGKELPCTCAGYLNLPMALECVLNRGKKFGGDVSLGEDFGTEFSDFDALYGAFKQQLRAWCELVINEINAIEERYPVIVRSPLFSATFSCCMERAKDAYLGGMVYNNTSICAMGIATAADSLIAIRKAVYEEQRISLASLCRILKNDWAENEALRMQMRERYPKHGNHHPAADALVRDLCHFLAECINRRPNARGGVYRLGLFSIDWIFSAGRRAGASADGRRAGEPFSKNIAAAPGCDRNGVTALIQSAAAMDQTEAPNGTVLDLALHPSAVAGEEGIAVMNALVDTYFALGGMAVHINVVDAETLRRAQQNPAEYRHLQVRLCGWNVYFTDLKPEVQEHLIAMIEKGNE